MAGSALLHDWAQAMTQLLYDAALITSGFSVDSPKEFGQRMYSVMQQVLSGEGATGSNGSSSRSSDSSTVTASQVIEPSEGSTADPWRK